MKTSLSIFELLFLIVNDKIRYTTALVLVTKQVALGTAAEIDKLPKTNFRARARAVFGHNCSGPSVPVRDYSYHPDYETRSYSALAMVQLEIDHSTVDLQPICPPPKYYIEPQFFALALSNNCKKPVVKLYEMEYVNPEDCKYYYRKSGLGLGMYGPGCRAPARFLDYGAAHRWVRRSVDNIGKPAVSRIAENMMVLRRSLGSVQRYGPCDPEETKYELYQDETIIEVNGIQARRVRYNVTVIAGIEYSCVVFRAHHTNRSQRPKLTLRRWCAGAKAMCKDLQFSEIEFYVEITFKSTVKYSMKAYGQQGRAVDVRRAFKYINEFKKRP